MPQNTPIATVNPMATLAHLTKRQRAVLKNNNGTVEEVVTNNPYFQIAQATRKKREELVGRMRRYTEKHNNSIKRLQELNNNPYKLPNNTLASHRKSALNHKELILKRLENLDREIKSLPVVGGKRSRRRRRKQV